MDVISDSAIKKTMKITNLSLLGHDIAISLAKLFLKIQNKTLPLIDPLATSPCITNLADLAQWVIFAYISLFTA